MISSKAVKVALVAGFTVACMFPAESQQRVNVERMTPILVVDSIEPVLLFWEALGFEPINPSRVDGNLIFIAFAKDGHEVHYQTLAHIEQQIPEATEMLSGSTSLLYLTVDDLDAVITALGAVEVVIPRRQTPWGADEIYVKEPGGHIIGFAQFGS